MTTENTIAVIEYDWEFISENHPNYSSSNEVLDSDDIQRFLDGEIPTTLEEVEEESKKMKGCYPKDLYIRLIEQITSIGDREDIIIRLNEINTTLYQEALISYKKEKQAPTPTLKDYTIYLTRTSTQHAEVDVQAYSIGQAEDKALDLAGDLDYKEKNVEYGIEEF
jgi:hypothetical protein